MEDVKPKKRPDMLTIFCVLSFLGSGLAAFSNFVFYVAFDQLTPVILEYADKFKGIDLILTGGNRYFLATAILNFVSLTGVFFLWHMKKEGFHIYTAAQVFLLFLPAVMLSGRPFSFLSLFLTTTFVAVYWSHLKFMD